jgi:chemotaxis protein histidine kinase CheA
MSTPPRIPSWITDPVWRDRYARWTSSSLRAFHRYAGWLVSLTWWRFAAYAAALLIAVSILEELPPFTWRVTEYVENVSPMEPPPKPPAPEEHAEAAEPTEPETPAVAAKPAGKKVDAGDYEISIGREGVRIGPKNRASDAAQVDISPEGVRIIGQAEPGASAPVIDIRVPEAVSEEIRRELQAAAEQARQEAQKSREQAQEAEQSRKELAAERKAWEKEYERELREWKRAQRDLVKRTRVVRSGEILWNLAFLWVLVSAIIKATYKGRKEAEAKAAAAEETAEAEALKRQLVEARLNTMQAQVEPHFLFNTLASIDHLIETDPKRASQMQKNLIALLRATMPTMREANGASNGLRDLKREMAVVRPYLEILQVRMEERLTTEISIPDGLLSAEFPPMIIQGLVENAIKHGLEPKPEGGSLRVSAHIEHGKLVVEVADTGLGFGRAATAGTGVGLANTRERLQLLYGNKASLTVAENQPCGTLIRITVPYRSNEPEAAS